MVLSPCTFGGSYYRSLCCIVQLPLVRLPLAQLHLLHLRLEVIAKQVCKNSCQINDPGSVRPRKLGTLWKSRREIQSDNDDHTVGTYQGQHQHQNWPRYQYSFQSVGYYCSRHMVLWLDCWFDSNCYARFLRLDCYGISRPCIFHRPPVPVQIDRNFLGGLSTQESHLPT